MKIIMWSKILPIAFAIAWAIGWVGIHALCPQCIVLWLASIVGA